MLFLTKFSSLNAFSAPTEKLKTKNRNEIAVIRNCVGKPTFAAFYDGVGIYVCHFELHDEARNEVKKNLSQKIQNHNCRDKKKCKKCKPFRTELNKLNKTRRNCNTLLKQRFAATKPGLIHGIHHEYLDT